MARFENVGAVNEKKLVLTDFLREHLEAGETEIYIYIRKLSRSIKKKIEFLQTNSVEEKKQRELLKKIREKGYKYSDLKKMKADKDRDKALDFIVDLDMSVEVTENMSEMALQVENLILEHGINPDDHSLKDMQGKIIKLSPEFWDKLGDDELTLYIIEQIELYSKGLSLGKRIERASTGQSET